MLCAVHCLLCAVYCLLCCLLYAVYCVLSTACCVLCIAYCLLCTLCCPLSTVHCVLTTACCVLCIAYCLLCTLLCAFHCPLSIVYCVLCTVYCLMSAGGSYNFTHWLQLPSARPALFDQGTRVYKISAPFCPGGAQNRKEARPCNIIDPGKPLISFVCWKVCMVRCLVFSLVCSCCRV